jgi:hypothetical protein
MARSARKGSTNARYSFKQHGSTSRKQGRLGDYVLQPNSGTEAWSPSWNHTTTVFRPFPVPSPEDPDALCGFKLSDDADDFDDWIRGYPTARSWGDPGITFLLYDPLEDFNPEEHPAWVLFRCVDGRVQAGQAPAHWDALLKGGQGRSAMLRAPQDLYLMQGALLEQRSKVYTPPRGGSPDDDLVILECTRSVIQELAPQLNTIDFDPVSLEAGSGGLFQIYQRGGAADPEQASDAGFGGRRGGISSREERVIGYGVKVIKEWNGTSGDLSSVADMVANKVKPWEDVVRIMTIEEQAHLLAKHFPADVIWEAFADHRYEGWIPEHVERAVTQSTSVAVPAPAPVPPGAPVPPASAADWKAPSAAPAAPASGWGAARPADNETASDPLARPTGPPKAVADSVEIDPTVPDGLPVDGIANAMQGGQQPNAPRSRADIVEEARRAVNDE